MQTVSFVRAADYDAPDFYARMDRLVAPVFDDARARPGATVLLKPNLLGSASPEKAATTHPRVVAYFIRRFRARGCRVLVGDSPAVEPLRHVAARSGILDAVEREGAELADFASEFESVRENPFAFRKLLLAGALRDADLVVNLAKVKSHAQMTLTLAVKNLFGCVVGMKKAGWHLKAGKDFARFAEMLCSAAAHADACLHVLDGVVSMEGNGPYNGTPRRTGFLAAAACPHALDAFVARLLGVDPALVPTLALARARGLPGAVAGGFRVTGDDPGALVIRDFRLTPRERIDWSLPGPLVRWIESTLAPRPEISSLACVGCAKCVRACPARAIDMDGRLAAIRHRDCIHCFCCQEICPVGAIEPRVPPLGRLLQRLLRRVRV